MCHKKIRPHRSYARVYSRRRDGFSMFPLKASSHLDANSSSTILWSQDRVTVIKLWIVSSAVSTGRVPPTAMIQAWGGLITAENSVIPYIPRLEMVKEPPWNSCSCNLPSLARLARSCFGQKKSGSISVSLTMYSYCLTTWALFAPPRHVQWPRTPVKKVHSFLHKPWKKVQKFSTQKVPKC